MRISKSNVFLFLGSPIVLGADLYVLNSSIYNSNWFLLLAEAIVKSNKARQGTKDIYSSPEGAISIHSAWYY